MKNKSSKLLVLSLAALLGVACSPAILPSDSQGVGESILVDGEGEADEIGAWVNLGRHNASSSAVSAKMGNYFGLQKIDEEGGKISVRFIVAVSGIDDIYSMYVKRSVTADDGSSVMEEKTIAIEKVYKSLTDASMVSWDGDNGLSGDVYYAVYTLKNIPEAHYSDAIEVEFGLRRWSGSTFSTSLKANGTSFVHPATQIEGLTFVAGSSSNESVKANEAYVNATSTALTEVEIPEKVYVTPLSYQKHIVKEATVVAIGNPSFSGYDFEGQGFYGCDKLSKVALPKTIRTFSPYVFEKCTALEEIELPECLTTIMKDAFGYKSSYFDYSCGLKRILWNAKNLSTAPKFDATDTYTYGMISWVLDKVVIGEKVESLPNYPLFGGGESTVAATLPKEVEWKKTEAERKALLASSPESDLDVENYLCTDTQKINLTYHIGEGSLSLDGASQTGDYSKQVYGMGRKLASPENPTPKAGYKFLGWYLDQAYSQKAEFPLTLGTEDVELFAKYDVAEEGEVPSTPKSLSLGSSITFTTSEAVPCQYFTFTADKEGSDYYYFQISDFAVSESSPNQRKSYDDNIWIYTDSGYSKLITPNRTTPFVDQVNGYSNYQLNVLLKKGETAYIKVAAYDIDTLATPSPVYGDITLKTFTEENDQTSEAIALVKGVEASYEKNGIHQDYISTFYKFTAEQTGYNLKLAQKGSHSLRATARLYKEGSLVRSLANLTLSGSSAETILSGLTVGDAYYLVIESDYLSTFEQGDGVSILLGDLPAGLAQENPIQGRLGGYNEVKDMSAKTRYYSFSLEQGKTYYLLGWRTSSSSSYSSKAGGAYSLLAPSGSSEQSGKLFTNPYSNCGKISFTAAETGTYVLSADVVNSGTWSSTSHLSGLCLVEEKAGFEESATYQNLDILCLKPAEKAIYDLALGEAQLGQLTSYLSFPTSSSSIYTGNAKLTLSPSSSASFFQVKTSSEAGATIKAEKAKGVLEGKNYVGKQFNGTIAGQSSFYRASIDSYGATDGERAFRSSNNLSVEELSSENGIATLQFTVSETLTKGYTDGRFLYAYVSGDEWFASSQAEYRSSIAGMWAKTSDYVAGGESGVEILSIVEGSARVYCAVIKGKVHLGVSVEFASGDSIGEEGASFSVKDSSGNLLGSYKVTAACSSDEIGTIVEA